MAVYTDGEHLMADTLEELHDFAKSIGLNPKWFQDHKYKYYDLFSPVEIKKAILSGAKYVKRENL